ncbi:MAG: hypothetical protein HY043_16380 [Verrucomicrobia bacterium]|nr:hypothetical protein [Verrucomicrobiota bacterium]
MNPRALFIINSDPRRSPRAAEAVRIAAGVGVWQQVEVTICLCEAAALTLTEAAGEFADGEDLSAHWKLIAEWGRPVFLETGAPLLKDLDQAQVKIERISTMQLAQMASQSDYVLRF